MFRSFLSRELQNKILEHCTPVPGVCGLLQYGASPNPAIESERAMHFIAEMQERTASSFSAVMQLRVADRAFIDQRTATLCAQSKSAGIEFASAEYPTVIGAKNSDGRVVVGPLQRNYSSGEGRQPVAPVPDFLKGPHVTMFGPPDTALDSLEAVNSLHRRLPTEPQIVTRLVDAAPYEPKWGADHEDSKTPIRAGIVDACDNLARVYNNTLTAELPATGGATTNGGATVLTVTLASTRRAHPIKRLPGLALPCPFLFHNGEPVPLHIYDLVLHLALNYKHREAMTFYFPKLETEGEAAYLAHVFREAEDILCAMPGSSYERGTIRVITVMESARAIYRLNEIADALYPYFVGASLGWHDFIASAARLFKNDSNYRIPVKADPNIVIKYVKASHHLVADVVGQRGGATIGGMYGVLPVFSPSASSSSSSSLSSCSVLLQTSLEQVQSRAFQVTLKGFFCDIVVQLRRGLTGFWVAHPDFVRIGIAMVEAWGNNQRDPKRRDEVLSEIICGYLSDKELREQALDFVVRGCDVERIPAEHPLYARKLLAADVGTSTVIANNHPDEVRYNVFQCLQYMAEWLQGRGCVSLPAIVAGAHVRVMDDLATTERSRWEVWHEIRHGRFCADEFLQIARDEFALIKKGGSERKRVHVAYNEGSAKWYEVAFKIMVRLMLADTKKGETATEPPEWVTELMIPFTLPFLREAADPWQEAQKIDPVKFSWKW